MFTPVGPMIAVKPDDIVREKDLGDGKKLIISYGDKENHHKAAVCEGTVISMSPLAYADKGDGKPWVKVGDHIIYGKHAGYPLLDPETKEPVVILFDEDVICIMHNGDK